MEDNILTLEYLVPIQSNAEIDGDFIINGIAISETTTSNGHKFLGEELSKAANTLIGVPLLKDHDNSVDSIVGKVSVAHWDESMRNIPFTAIVKDSKVKQLIRDGLLNTVSVGAHVRPEDIEETDDGEIIPHNIEFKELSVVAVPADGAATFQVALNNAYKSYSNKENLQSNERGDNMTKKEKMTESEEESKEESKEESEEVSEEKELDEKIKTLEIKAKKKKLARLLEADADEEAPKEEAKEEVKEEEAKEEEEEEEEESEEEEEDEVEEKGNYIIKQGYNSVGIERKSYVYN